MSILRVARTGCGASMILVASVAQAQNVIAVTTIADIVNGDAETSLREAFDVANADGQASEIHLAPASTYVLDLCGASEDANASGDLDVTESHALTILGAGSTLDMQCAGERIIHKIDSGGSLELQNLTLTGGDTPGNGAALYVVGDNTNFQTVTITLTNVEVTGNASAAGGAIGLGSGDPAKVLNVTSSNIHDNTGAGINTGFFASTTIIDSTISNNLNGSGVSSSDGAVTVIDSDVTNNGAHGVRNTGNGTPTQIVTIDNSSISDNTLLGVICSECAGIDVDDSTISGNGSTGVELRTNAFGLFSLNVDVAGSTISNNGATEDPEFGGGISVSQIDEGGQRPTLTVSDTSINANTAQKGGGIYVEEGDVVGFNVTLDGNTAVDGGGIFISEPTEFPTDVPTAIFEASTITNNSASGQGGGVAFAYIEATITDSLIANNVANVGGGLFADNLAEIEIIATTLATNTANSAGSGIANYEGLITLNRSAVVGNLGDTAAIHSPGGALSVINTTIAQNSGRGISVVDFGDSLPAPTSVLFSTIVENGQSGLVADGAGIAISWDPADGPGGPHVIESSILANNIAAAEPDCSFDVDPSQGHNIFGDAAGCGVLQPGDIGGAPGLEPLSDDSTTGNAHYPLVNGSAAVDAAGACPPPNADQIGTQRAQGVACDIGAIEMTQEMQTVMIDVGPGNDSRQRLNRRGNGVIWVAILSDLSAFTPFDPSSQVDMSTVVFGPAAVGPERYAVRDLNNDGLGDVLFRFRISKAGFGCGDSSATLSGETYDGVAFSGSDEITVRGCFPGDVGAKHHRKLRVQ